MSSMYDFLWTKWDKKLSELERSIQPSGARTSHARGARDKAPNAGQRIVPCRPAEGLRHKGGSAEGEYLSNIIRQNVNEIKELNLKFARQVVDIERLNRELEAAGQKKTRRDRYLRNGRMRILFALKKLRIKLREYRKENIDFRRQCKAAAQECGLIKKENEFLKTELNSHMTQALHYIDKIKDLEKTITGKEDQLSNIYSNLRASEETNEKLLREVEKLSLENRMMQIRHEIRKQEAKAHRGSFRKWLSTPLLDVKL